LTASSFTAHGYSSLHNYDWRQDENPCAVKLEAVRPPPVRQPVNFLDLSLGNALPKSLPGSSSNSCQEATCPRKRTSLRVSLTSRSSSRSCAASLRFST